MTKGNQKFTEAAFKAHMDKHTREPTIQILKESAKKKKKDSKLDLSEAQKENQNDQKPKKKKFSERHQKKAKKKKKATFSESLFERSKNKKLLEEVDREALKNMNADEIVNNEENGFSLQQYLLVKEEEMKRKEKENLQNSVKKNETNAVNEEEPEVTLIDPNSLAANIIKSIKDRPIKEVKTKRALAFGELEEYKK